MSIRESAILLSKAPLTKFVCCSEGRFEDKEGSNSVRNVPSDTVCCVEFSLDLVSRANRIILMLFAPGCPTLNISNKRANTRRTGKKNYCRGTGEPAYCESTSIGRYGCAKPVKAKYSDHMS